MGALSRHYRYLSNHFININPKRMKIQLTKKFFAIIIVMMCCLMPELVNAQKKCRDGNCPKGQVCLNGICVKSDGGGGCNCFIRPIPYECGQICGWRTVSNESISISLSGLSAIRFRLLETQNVSAKIFDATGRLITTIAGSKMYQGDHIMKWNGMDKSGKTVSAGIYILQLIAGTYSDTKKLLVINL